MPGKTNQPPVAKAGDDQVIVLPKDSVLLNGASSYDPDGPITTYHWTKISGPTSGAIGQPDAAITIVKPLQSGIYNFELTVTDTGGLSDKDTIQVIVNDPLVNQPPVAKAGLDQIITLPTDSILLNGVQSFDPDGNIVSWQWTKISGPVSYSFSNSQATQTKVYQLTQGIYTFVLNVTDNGGLSAKDTVVITINAAPVVISCSGRQVVPAQLTEIGTLSIPGFDLISASAGNKIAFASGLRSTGYSTRVDIYDIPTNTWSTAELSIAERQGAAVAAVGNKILFGGGGDNDNGIPTSRVDIYNTSTNTWSTAQLSQAREYLSAVTVGNKVIFAGGGYWYPSFIPSAVVDIYDDATNTWSTAALSVPRWGMSAVADGNKAYFSGGVGGPGYGNVSSVVDIYDASSNTWTWSNMQQARFFHTGIFANGKIYWAGGIQSTAGGNFVLSNNAEIIDLATNTTSNACIIPRSRFTAVAKNNYLVFFTGDQGNGLPNTDFEIYNMTTDTWATGVLPQSITLCSVISVNNTIYIAGGMPYPAAGSPTNKVWKLTF